MAKWIKSEKVVKKKKEKEEGTEKQKQKKGRNERREKSFTILKNLEWSESWGFIDVMHSLSLSPSNPST